LLRRPGLVVEFAPVKAGAKEPRSSRFSTLGAFLTIGIAGAIGYAAWHIVLRSEPASSEGSARSSESAASNASCSFPATFWIDQNGRKRTVADLKEIETQHNLWVSSKHQHGEKADFHGRIPRESAADLSCVDMNGFRLAGADLRGAGLVAANLSGADLSDADLRLANLTDADLSGSKLEGANLEGDSPLVATDLSHARMKGASFIGAKLKYALFLDHADLSDAQLGGAELPGANFTGAQLAGVDVTKAQFDGATDLEKAELASLVFEPSVPPDAENIYDARGLELLTFANGDKKALTALRNSFRDDGYDLQERQITYALQHASALLEWDACSPWKDAAQFWQGREYIKVVSNCVEASLNELIFDLPFQYGMNPNRPLYIVGALWLLCSIVYAVIIKARRRSAIYLVCQRDYRDGRTIIRRTRIVPRPVNAPSALGRFWQIVWREIAVWRVAVFFSLQSALNIGFQELELGRWLKLLTTREYDLKAVGWARSLSGTQSLLSLLMLALFVWALFGQPFSS
jgi:uncharacterized protein YjbI with pentapeptide repeats